MSSDAYPKKVYSQFTNEEKKQLKQLGAVSISDNTAAFQEPNYTFYVKRNPTYSVEFHEYVGENSKIDEVGGSAKTFSDLLKLIEKGKQILDDEEGI